MWLVTLRYAVSLRGRLSSTQDTAQEFNKERFEAERHNEHLVKERKQLEGLLKSQGLKLKKLQDEVDNLRESNVTFIEQRSDLARQVRDAKLELGQYRRFFRALKGAHNTLASDVPSVRKAIGFIQKPGDVNFYKKETDAKN